MLIDPTISSLTINFVLALAVLLLGIAFISLSRDAVLNIVKMTFAGTGLLMIILGLVAFIMPQIAITILIALLALGLLIMGVGLLVGGYYTKKGWTTLLGILILILSLIVIAYPAVGEYMIAIMLAVAIILGGISAIVSGIKGT